MSVKKNKNWLVEEFTTIDLPEINEGSPVRKAHKDIKLQDGEHELEFKAMEAEYDAQGRPVKTINFSPDGEVDTELFFQYSATEEKTTLKEDGEDTSQWVFSFDEQGRIIKREFIDLEDDSKETELYEYDSEGRLVRFREAAFDGGKLVEDSVLVYKLEWEGEQLKEVLEFISEGEDEELDTRSVFSYNAAGHVESVKSFLLGDEGEDLSEEQKPEYDAQGRIMANTIHYHVSSERLQFLYAYDAEGELKEVTTRRYQENDLIHESNTQNNERGFLHSRSDKDLIADSSESESFSYEFAEA